MKVSELFEAKVKALVKVVARKNPNGAHGPTGTFTVKSFEKDGNSVYVKIQDNGGWGINFEKPPEFLKFVRADNSQPITLAAAYKLWQDSQKSDKLSKTKVNESTDHLEDAIRDNWLSTSNSAIIKILKDKIKSGEKEWQYLNGKSDEELEDLVDDAKYQARNQYS